MASIVMAYVAMALQVGAMPEWYEQTLQMLNLSFTVIFIVEMVVKLLGLGISEYMRDRCVRPTSAWPI